MATSLMVASVPEKPHQPTNLTFPKRSFGQKGVLRCFQSSWFTQWPFLHYDEAQDVTYCHTCLMAFKLKRMKSTRIADPAFVSETKNLSPTIYSIGITKCNEARCSLATINLCMIKCTTIVLNKEKSIHST